MKLARTQRILVATSRAVVALGLALSFAAGTFNVAKADTYPLSYAGRLTQGSGEPLAGPVAVELKFWSAASGGTQLGGTYSFQDVVLSQGLFQVQLRPSAAEIADIFGDGTRAVFAEVAAAGKTYPRQEFTFIPLALRVPVDSQTIAFDSNGALSLAVTGAPAANQFLTKDGSGKLVWQTPSVAAPSAEPPITAGTASQYWRGDKTWQALTTTTVPESGTALYYSDVRARASLSGTAPIDYSVMTGAISMTQAGASSSGYLSSADWASFNGKQNALGFNPVNKSGDTMSGALDLGSQKITNLAAPVAASDAVTKNYADAKLGGKTLDVGTPSNGQVVKWDQTNQKFYLDTDQVGVSGGGIATINGLSTASQSLTTSTSGSALGVGSSGSTHTINIPMASMSGVVSGLISNADYQSFNGKLNNVVSGSGVSVSVSSGTATVSLSNVGSVGTYAKVVTNAQGQVISGGTLTAAEIPSLDASKIGSGVVPTANGGTGLSSTATFPASGVVVTRDATETLTNKTLGAATINGASSIGGSTSINTTGTATTGALTASTVTSQGSVTVRGDGSNANKLVLNDKSNINYVAFKAPDTLGSQLTWELPSSNGTAGQVLSTNGAGTLSWVSGVAPTGAASGDLTGNFPGPTLAAIGNAGTYTKVTTDAKGRVVSGATLTSSDLPAMVGANGSVAGTAGAVPGPAATDNTKFLRGDGAWASPAAAAAGASNQIQYNSGGSLASNANFVYSGGNVGIGTTNPGAKVDSVTGAAAVDAFRALSGAANYPVSIAIGRTATEGKLGVAGNTDNYAVGSAPGDIVLRTESSGQKLILSSYVTNANNATLTVTNGNVGIGTTAPIGTLDMGTTGSICLGGSCKTAWPASGNQWTTNGNDIYKNNVGNVGIGTTSPIRPLQVVSSSPSVIQSNPTTANGTAAFATYDGPDTNNAGYFAFGIDNTGWSGLTPPVAFIAPSKNGTGVARDLVFATGTGPTEKMRLTTSGTVGIGTTSPTEAFHVAGSDATGHGVWALVENTHGVATSSYSVLGLKSAGAVYGSLTGGGTNPTYGLVNGMTVSAGSGTQDIGFRVGSAAFSGGASGPAVIIKSTGNVGIGTTNPAAQLAIYQPTQNSTPSRLQLQTSNSDSFVISEWGYPNGKSAAFFGQNIQWSNTGSVVQLNSSNPSWFSFMSSNNDAYYIGRMAPGAAPDTQTYFVTLNSSGNVGIGTTSPSAKLEVAGTAGTDGIKFPDGSVQTSASGNVSLYYTANTTTSLTANNMSGAIAFASKVWDTHNAFNGSTFTAPSAGIYQVSSCIVSNNGALAAFELNAFKNGARYLVMNGGANYSANVLCGTALVKLAASDTMDLRAYTTSSGASIANAYYATWIQIIRMSN